mmetsp:Transcript_2694/g.9015  ORF Transcript_2694/g.9015 Transcript_2694/m.9015 type:complete len:245 (-) Transcript_2694:1027-1761(-)
MGQHAHPVGPERGRERTGRERNCGREMRGCGRQRGSRALSTDGCSTSQVRDGHIAPEPAAGRPGEASPPEPEARPVFGLAPSRQAGPTLRLRQPRRLVLRCGVARKACGGHAPAVAVDGLDGRASHTSGTGHKRGLGLDVPAAAANFRRWRLRGLHDWLRSCPLDASRFGRCGLAWPGWRGRAALSRGRLGCRPCCGRRGGGGDGGAVCAGCGWRLGGRGRYRWGLPSCSRQGVWCRHVGCCCC